MNPMLRLDFEPVSNVPVDNDIEEGEIVDDDNVRKLKPSLPQQVQSVPVLEPGYICLDGPLHVSGPVIMPEPFFQSGRVSRRDFRAERQEQKIHSLCPVYTKYGTCNVGSNCPFIHDASRTTICPSRLQKIPCSDPNCKLSHKWSFNNVPTCVFFMAGNCTLGSECTFAHLDVSLEFPQCEQFCTTCYCWLGQICPKVHHLASYPHLPQTPYPSNAGPVPTAQPVRTEQRSETTRQKTGETKDTQNRVPSVTTSMTTSQLGMIFMRENEEFIRARDQGSEFADQKDFVPL